MKKHLLLLPIGLALCACDSGELSQVKKEIKSSNCSINLPSTCEQFIALSDKEKNERQKMIPADNHFDEWADTKKHIAKLKKQHGDKLCDSKDYADIINQYETVLNHFDKAKSFGIPLKDRTLSCVEPLNHAAKLCNYDSSVSDWEATILWWKNVYATYLQLCEQNDVYKHKKEILAKNLKKEQRAKCKDISYCKNNLSKGCVTTLPMDKSCLTTAQVIFTDEAKGGIFVQPRQDSVSTMFANGFINAFGLGENVACRDLYFIKTQKQFFSQDRVSLSGYWRYVGPYKYSENNAERTTKAFEKVTISDEINALCGGPKQTSATNELESLMHIFGK